MECRNAARRFRDPDDDWSACTWKKSDLGNITFPSTEHCFVRSPFQPWSLRNSFSSASRSELTTARLTTVTSCCVACAFHHTWSRGACVHHYFCHLALIHCYLQTINSAKRIKILYVNTINCLLINLTFRWRGSLVWEWRWLACTMEWISEKEQPRASVGHKIVLERDRMIPKSQYFCGFHHIQP